MAYLNGQIPGSALVGISGRTGARLLSGPAASWERVYAEVFRRYGWHPLPTGPNDAYRDQAVQALTFLDRYVAAKTGGGYYGDVRWWNGVRYVRKKGKAAAAVPGTSNHGKGRAVDVTGLGGFTGVRYAQFAAVAIPLGWSNAEGRSVNEPWHWVDLLSPETVTSGHAVIPGVSVPTYPIVGPLAPLVPEEDIVVTREENKADITAIVTAAVAPLLRRSRVFKLDVPGSQALWAEVGTSARIWLKTAAEVKALAPIDPAGTPLPADDEFWARTVVYGVGELYRRKGDASGAAYVLAGADVDGRRVPTIRHVGATEYAAMNRPLLVDVDPAHPGLWSRPLLGA